MLWERSESIFVEPNGLSDHWEKSFGKVKRKRRTTERAT